MYPLKKVKTIYSIKNSILHSFNTEEHDFDKDINSKNTIELLDKTIGF